MKPLLKNKADVRNWLICKNADKLANLLRIARQSENEAAVSRLKAAYMIRLVKIRARALPDFKLYRIA